MKIGTGGRRIILAATIVVGSLSFAACKAKLTGHVTIDGASFNATSCRSGAALGFSGVELSDASQRRVRLLLQADGTCTAAVFSPGAVKGDSLGTCGALEIHMQNSRINNVQNVRGEADLSCKAGGHELIGKLDFANCH